MVYDSKLAMMVPINSTRILEKNIKEELRKIKRRRWKAKKMRWKPGLSFTHQL